MEGNLELAVSTHPEELGFSSVTLLSSSGQPKAIRDAGYLTAVEASKKLVQLHDPAALATIDKFPNNLWVTDHQMLGGRWG